MFCPNCGTQNDGGVAFCQNCGTSLSILNNTTYQQSSSNANMKVLRLSRPIINIVKNKGASAVFLVAVIAFTASGIFRFLESINGYSGILGYIYRLASMIGLDYFYYNLYEIIHSISFVVALIGMVPIILLSIGMWITYASAVNRHDNGMKTSGLTIIKVVSIINLIFVCIYLSVIEIVMLIALIDMSNSYFTSSAIGVVIGVMIGTAVGFTFVIIYYAKVIKTVNTAKTTITTGKASDKISSYVAVISFILGSFCVISSLPIFNSSYRFDYMDILVLFENICAAVAYIAFGICVFSYKKEIRKHIASQTYPLYNSDIPNLNQNFEHNSYVTYNKQNSVIYDQPTTVLNNNTFTTCTNCGNKYDSYNVLCPYCGKAH